MTNFFLLFMRRNVIRFWISRYTTCTVVHSATALLFVCCRCSGCFLVYSYSSKPFYNYNWIGYKLGAIHKLRNAWGGGGKTAARIRFRTKSQVRSIEFQMFGLKTFNRRKEFRSWCIVTVISKYLGELGTCQNEFDVSYRAYFWKLNSKKFLKCLKNY